MSSSLNNEEDYGVKNKQTDFGNDFLDEDFRLTGNKDYKLEEALKYMSDKTYHQTVIPAEFTLFSIVEVNKKKEYFYAMKLLPDFIDLALFLTNNTQKHYFAPNNKNIGILPFDNFRQSGMTEKQIGDIAKSGFFLQHNGKTRLTLIPSKALMATLCRQLGVGKLNAGIDPIRDIFLASRMKDADPIQMVYRQRDGYAKAFGCFSSRFHHRPQTVVYDIKNKISDGKIALTNWDITHFLTRIDYAYPEEQRIIGGVKIIPGTRIQLSDVGDSSYILQNTLHLNGGIVLLQQMESRKHSGELDVGEFTSAYREKKKEIGSILEQIQAMSGESVDNMRETELSLHDKIKLKSSFGPIAYDEYLKKYSLEDKRGTMLDVILHMLKIPSYMQNVLSDYILREISACIGRLF